MEKRAINILYTTLGLIVGVLSIFLANFLYLFSLGITIYLVSIIPIIKKLKNDKVRTLVLDTFITYFLSWFIIYFLLTNLV